MEPLIYSGWQYAQLKIIISQTPLQQCLGMMVLRHSYSQEDMSEVYQKGVSGRLAKWDRLNCHWYFVFCYPSFTFLKNKRDVWTMTSHLETMSISTRDKNTEKGAVKRLGACPLSQATSSTNSGLPTAMLLMT